MYTPNQFKIEDIQESASKDFKSKTDKPSEKFPTGNEELKIATQVLQRQKEYLALKLLEAEREQVEKDKSNKNAEMLLNQTKELIEKRQHEKQFRSTLPPSYYLKLAKSVSGK